MCILPNAFKLLHISSYRYKIINHIDRLFPKRSLSKLWVLPKKYLIAIQECHCTQQNYRYKNLSSIINCGFSIYQSHYSLWQVSYSVRAHKLALDRRESSSISAACCYWVLSSLHEWGSAAVVGSGTYIFTFLCNFFNILRFLFAIYHLLLMTFKTLVFIKHSVVYWSIHCHLSNVPRRPFQHIYK